MSSPLIVPKFAFPGGVYGVAGSALAGFKLNTYASGTSTPQATYTDSTLSVANANPVIMDANGQANVWLGNSSYKFVGTDASGTVVWTVDNVTQSSLGQAQSEWVSFNAVPVFISITSFSLTGIADLTVSPYFVAIGTRVRTVNTGGTIYSTVTAVSANTLTVKNDSGVLDAGLSSASYGIIGGAQSSLAKRSLYIFQSGANVTMVNAVTTSLSAIGTNVLDNLNEGTTSGTFLAKVAGTYQASGLVSFVEGAATTGIQNVAQQVQVRKNSAVIGSTFINWPIAASTISSQVIPFNFTAALAASDVIDIACTAGFTGTAPTANILQLKVERLA